MVYAHFALKVALSMAVILVVAAVARYRPSLGGLISVMPLTGLLALFWVYDGCGGDLVAMRRYTLGVMWGGVPALLFFVAAHLGFRRGLHLGAVLAISAAVWVAGALVHQLLLGRRP